MFPLEEWIEAAFVGLMTVSAAVLPDGRPADNFVCPLTTQEAETDFGLHGVYGTRPEEGDLGRRGCILVKYDIADSGQPVNVQVVRSYHGAPYRGHAVHTVSTWSFPPASKDTPGAPREDLGVIFYYD